MSQNKFDLSRSLIEMQTRKSKLGLEKARLQEDVRELTEMLKSKSIHQSHGTHDEIVMRKKNAIYKMDQIELEILELKSDIKKRNQLKEEASALLNRDDPKLIEDLVAMRDYYQDFASDKTRIQASRFLASDVAKRLTQILKR